LIWTILLYRVPYSWGGAGFQIVSFSFLIWWFRTTPPPGFAVAALAIAATIMAVRALRFTRIEEIAWILIAFAFFGIEIRAITQDRDQHDKYEAKTRNDANKHFEDILRNAQQQFSATMRETETVLKTTESVGTLAQKNLESVTGGKSYAIVTPQAFSGLVPIPLTIRNFGAQTLTGVTVTIRGPEAWDAIKNPNNPYSMFRAEADRIDVGTLHAGEIKVLARTITPTISDASKDQVAVYDLDIAAQNFTAEEHLLFKHGKRIPWVFQYTVMRQFIKSQSKDKTTFNYKILAKTSRWYGED
jgi:hypothetical protein